MSKRPPYACAFEVLAPIRVDNAVQAMVQSVSGETCEAGVALFVSDNWAEKVDTFGQYGACYIRSNGTIGRIRRSALPIRTDPKDAEHDLIAYADRKKWFIRRVNPACR